jgi:hypothetical protein
MSNIQALRKEASPPPRSPERDALAAAIAKHTAAQEHLAKISTALEKADAASTETYRAVKSAKSTLDEAIGYEKHHLVATALGDADPGTSTAAAQAALDKAQTSYDAAKKLVAALRADCGGAAAMGDAERAGRRRRSARRQPRSCRASERP